jgi:aromatic ring hydroxylase
MATYKIAKMRVVRPSEKMREKHPDRFATIFGVFSNEQGQRLSITSKVITIDEAMDTATVIDVSNGILTLADGKRGRTETIGLSQDEIEAELNSLRNS